MILHLFLVVSVASLRHPSIGVVDEVRSWNRRTPASATSSSCPNVRSFNIANVVQRPEIRSMLFEFEAQLNQILNQTTDATALHAQIVFYNQTVYSKGFGVRRFDRLPLAAPDENTIFRVGSVSKLFASLLTFIGNDRGVIHSLDDPVSDYVPQFSVRPPFPLTMSKNGAARAGKVTFRQLLSQMSGLQREAPCDASCNVTTDDILQRLASMPQIVMPDTVPRYSNLAYALLGRLVPERVIGNNVTFDDMLLAAILKPLRMSRTGSNFTDVLNGAYGDNVCLSYVGSKLNAAIGLDLGWLSPAGSLFSTPMDLARLLKEYIAGWNLQGVVLENQDLYRQMFSTAFVDADMQSGFGMPFEILFFNATSVGRKSGRIPGYSALVAVAPQLGVGITFNINGAFSSLEAPGNDLIETAIRAFVKLFTDISPPMPPQPPSTLNAYVGNFNMFQDGSQIPGEFTNITVDATTGMLRITSTQIASCVVSEQVHARWLYDDTFAFVTPPTALCIVTDMIALDGTILVFQRDSMTNDVVSFEMPGYAWGVTFKK